MAGATGSPNGECIESEQGIVNVIPNSWEFSGNVTGAPPSKNRSLLLRYVGFNLQVDTLTKGSLYVHNLPPNVHKHFDSQVRKANACNGLACITSAAEQLLCGGWGLCPSYVNRKFRPNSRCRLNLQLIHDRGWPPKHVFSLVLFSCCPGGI